MTSPFGILPDPAPSPDSGDARASCVKRTGRSLPAAGDSAGKMGTGTASKRYTRARELPGKKDLPVTGDPARAEPVPVLPAHACSARAAGELRPKEKQASRRSRHLLLIRMTCVQSPSSAPAPQQRESAQSQNAQSRRFGHLDDKEARE